MLPFFGAATVVWLAPFGGRTRGFMEKSKYKKTGFTLVELLAAIGIIALLVTVAGVFVINYVSYSKKVSDQRTLEVLNDALTRYKCEGGRVAALTVSTPIPHVIAALQTAVT